MSNISIKPNVHIELEEFTRDDANDPLNPTAKFACKDVTVQKETKTFLNRVQDFISKNKKLFLFGATLMITVVCVFVIKDYIIPYISRNNDNNLDTSSTYLPITGTNTTSQPTTTEKNNTSRLLLSPPKFKYPHYGKNISNDQPRFHNYLTCREFIPGNVECRNATMLRKTWKQKTENMVVPDGNKLVMLCKRRIRRGCEIVAKPENFGSTT